MEDFEAIASTQAPPFLTVRPFIVHRNRVHSPLNLSRPPPAGFVAAIYVQPDFPGCKTGLVPPGGIGDQTPHPGKPYSPNPPTGSAPLPKTVGAPLDIASSGLRGLGGPPFGLARNSRWISFPRRFSQPPGQSPIENCYSWVPAPSMKDTLYFLV